MSGILKRIRRRLHTLVELAIIGVFGAVIPRLSRRGERRLAAFAGTLLFRTARRERRIAMANLDVVYGASKTRAEKLLIAKESFAHTALIFFDYFWFSRDTKARLEEFCVCDDPTMRDWISGRFPGFLITAHIGNWELAGQYISSRGRRLWSVFSPIGSKKTLSRLSRFRGITGQQIIAKSGAAAGILRALKSGDLVALVMDQHADPRDGGIFIDFFGLHAAFSNLCGVIANRLKTPICAACVRHDATKDKYEIKCYGVISAEEASRMAPDEITVKLAGFMREMVLDNPAQWLWSYRRWKRCPADDDLSRFPFYAVRETES